ncbi:hypothetical protein DJ79_08870 [Halorubrum ezzemoulense]|uniref:Uncharacterized protein n=1 Tax=Halorubrum ezzemoulense TaxID=337243 RepID=A0A256JFL0_HALEZ|nr:hypothetical protein [Halorubrum ezzemoulense]OYR67540.1 hypothetical protein DJ79_08870 [Halorubrum ezzemoulense]
MTDERTVRCPVEGCDDEVLARGINLHVMRSSGDGHGPKGDVPDHLSFEDLETIGKQDVEMDYPETRDNEKHARLCPYCSQVFLGIQGLMIHLGQTAGRKNHPKNPKEKHDPSDFPQVKVDEEGNILETIETESDNQVERRGVMIPESRVLQLVSELAAEGKTDAASRIRGDLIEADAANRPDHEDLGYPDLAESLLDYGRTDSEETTITAALESEGIMVACDGESAFLTAEEALKLGTHLEFVAAGEGWEDRDCRDLIEFLRHGADLLNSGQAGRGLHEEFSRWK